MPQISKLINVTSLYTGGGVLRRLFGIMLFLTRDSAVLGTGANRISVVSSPDDAADAGFLVGTEPRDAVDIACQQVPYPKNIVLGRWIETETAAEIEGTTPAAVASLKAADASWTCKGIDFEANTSGAVDHAAVAALIQTELRTESGADPDFTDATCVYNVTLARYEVTTGTATGATATLTVFSPVSPAAGTDISALSGLDEGATLNQGADAETITAAIEACLALNDSPYFICHDLDIVDYATIDAVRTWVGSREYAYFIDGFEVGALVPGESASVFAQLFVAQPERVVGIQSATPDYKALSLAARYSSINFNGANTLITGMLKNLPGTEPDDYTTTQQSGLEEKYVNYFAPWFSSGSPDTNAVYNGTTMKPLVWFDARYFLDWAVNAIRVDVFNLLATSGKVPQTEAGVAAIQRVMTSVMEQAVRNGGIAPGQLSEAMALDIRETTGNSDFDGYLPTGFLIFATSIADQSQSARNLRQSPPFKIWMKGSGAIHSVDISLIYEN